MLRLKEAVPEVKRAIDEAAMVRQIKRYLAPSLAEARLTTVARSAELVKFRPGDTLIEEGATDEALYLIRSGSVAVSRKVRGTDTVLAYVPAGDYVGERAVLTKGPRSATVTAAVATEAIRIEGAALRALVEQHEELRQELSQRARRYVEIDAWAELAPREAGRMKFLIQHGFTEATNILLIDESLCVRCDNCETACAETHDGVSRLNREAGPTFDYIHVPSSCRHCEHPHCMKDCPPDAIKRDGTGEVYVTDACIGCGNCERNCPYGGIRMAETPAPKPGLLRWLLFGAGPGPGEDQTPDGLARRTGGKRAVKCDMCRDEPAGPACVRACPTGAALRVNPEAFATALRGNAEARAGADVAPWAPARNGPGLHRAAQAVARAVCALVSGMTGVQ
jgi:Fe-S-cluster-containing hydrogenase component 2/CRP-like cAMP-binding protein